LGDTGILQGSAAHPRRIASHPHDAIWLGYTSAMLSVNLFWRSSQHWITEKRLYHGRQRRSGRPGDHWTNVLTEIASPTLCWQEAHVSSRDLSPHERDGPDVKESCGDLRTSRF